MNIHHRPEEIATQATQLAIAVPQVVAYRVSRLMLAGANPSAHDRDEFTLMGVEKWSAFIESWLAMTTHILQAQQQMAMSVLRALANPFAFSNSTLLLGHSQELPQLALGVVSSGLAPVHRRAVENARRLGAGGGAGAVDLLPASPAEAELSQVEEAPEPSRGRRKAATVAADAVTTSAASAGRRGRSGGTSRGPRR